MNSGTPDYAAPRPVDDTPPLELAQRFVDGSGLRKDFPGASLVMGSDGDKSQTVLLVQKSKIVGEFGCVYGEYGWESSLLQYC